MPQPLDPSSGVHLSVDAFGPDFGDRMWIGDGQPSWKLERRQTFREPGSPSWSAFAAGDWETALRLCQEQRPRFGDMATLSEQHQSYFHRVRVVEEQVTPYLQWELHFIRVRAANRWERIRVIPASRLAELETRGPLPEIVTLCGKSLYQVLYTDDGLPDGALRYSDPELVVSWENLISHLYGLGEDIGTYVDRVIAPLPPPVVQDRRD